MLRTACNTHTHIYIHIYYLMGEQVILQSSSGTAAVSGCQRHQCKQTKPKLQGKFEPK